MGSKEMADILPEDFVRATRLAMGEERFGRYLASFSEEAPVSIRENVTVGMEGEPVPWCHNAYYLASRPNFIFDPLLHAGCYYVQEAASMFLDTVLRQCLPALGFEVRRALDLCAAPGGKSTLLRSVLPDDCVLYSNEPIPKRASILLENITKWRRPNCIVTNNYPKDYVRAGLKFDVILCDVPCSGEGMFRKDSATISEWSQQHVEKCWRLQRDIVSDAWQCLHEGGLLVYSTCTFNTRENEENVRWMLDTFDATLLPIDTEEAWGITGSLLPGFTEPVFRFIPGITRSEGLFMAVVRKGGDRKPEGKTRQANGLKVLPPPFTLPPHPVVDLSYQQAIAYLRGEALMLPPETPRGLITVSFQGHPLGPVKNLGARANNLYPKPWRIRTTHLPKNFP